MTEETEVQDDLGTKTKRVVRAVGIETGKGVGRFAAIIALLAPLAPTLFDAVAEQLGLPEMRAELEAQRAQVEALTTVLERRAAVDARKYITEPPLVFTSGASVSDCWPGGRCQMTWRFDKRHECGAPKVNVYVRNGGDLIHRFTDISIADSRGSGIDAPTGIQALSYTARLPADVTLGEAAAFVVLDYPGCPATRPVYSSEVPFEIVANPR